MTGRNQTEVIDPVQAEIVVADPRLSVVASRAQRWLPIRPGTDTALLLAWIHVLLAEGGYDRDYVARYTTGIEALRQEMAPYTPQWAQAQAARHLKFEVLGV